MSKEQIDFKEIQNDLLNHDEVKGALQHGLASDPLTAPWLRYGGLRMEPNAASPCSPAPSIGATEEAPPAPVAVHGIRMNQETGLSFRLYFQGLAGHIDVEIGSPLGEMLTKVIEGDLLKGVIHEED